MEAIIAINKLGVIGVNGRLPWKSKDDLQHFKRLTQGKVLVVGRKTAEKLPNLKGRTVHVLSRGLRSLEAQIAIIKPDFVIGGSEIYDLLLPLCDVIHVSLINDVTDGDTYYTIPDRLKKKCIYYEFNTNENEN